MRSLPCSPEADAAQLEHRAFELRDDAARLLQKAACPPA